MILLVHMLFGAAIASYIKNSIWAVILAFLSHYLLDLMPHIEYNIGNIKEKQWNKATPDIIKVTLDLLSGVFLILLFFSQSTLSAGRQAIIFVAVFFAILPDGLTFLGYFYQNNFLEFHKKFHQEKVHFLKNKKLSVFWRVSAQILITLIALTALFPSFF